MIYTIAEPVTHILMSTLNTVALGRTDIRVTPICLGTMTFGEQVKPADAHAILSRSLERGVNFIDTAEMYAVPARAETCGATETIIGEWCWPPRWPARRAACPGFAATTPA